MHYGSLKTTAARRGLSTLELVLSLPILLLFVALMINFGTVASWKVRSLSVAREVAWSTRWPRDGANNPRPAYWPENGGSNTNPTDNALQLDAPEADHPVVRGPTFFSAQVDRDVLNPSRGFRVGRSQMSRDWPMLPKLGRYHLQAANHFVDDAWQYQRMGLGSTNARRMPVIYTLPQASTGLSQKYVEAVMAILNNPQREALNPLDNDEDYRAYQILLGFSGPPDFHPALAAFCSLDRELAEQRVSDLIDRIQGHTDPDVEGVPERMTEAFINLYNRVIDAFENQLSGTPPPSPAEQGAIRAEINALQQKIDALQQFLTTLQSGGTLQSGE